VDAATQSFLAALPPPVKDAAVAVGSGIAAAAHTAVEHPRAAAVITAAVAVPAAISYYKGRYAGYAGELSPGQVCIFVDVCCICYIRCMQCTQIPLKYLLSCTPRCVTSGVL
jgi:hypothetical protein